MKKLYVISALFILLIGDNAFGNEQWIQLASFGGDARHRCTGFSVGNKGYIGGGHINSGVSVYHEDYWQYDPGSDSWTQIADFGGGKRYHAVGFTIGEFGYVGCGEDDANNYYNDFYRYVPLVNAWQSIADYPGNPRRGACSFVIDDFGYVGTGQSDFGYEDDFYMYDPINDSWFAAANFMGEARSAAVGFSHNGKGYVGTGHVVGNHTKDFYEYDAFADNWIQKSDVGTTFRQDATGFVLNGKGYITTGNDVDGDFNYEDVWEYNFADDQWIQIEDFCGEGRRYMVSFVIGNIAYAGTGTDGTNLKDFWMFNPILGAEDPLDKINIVPYPNPSVDQITFRLGNQAVSFSLFSLDGKLVFKQEKAVGSLRLEKNDFGAGTFIYDISSADDGYQRGKITFR